MIHYNSVIHPFFYKKYIAYLNSKKKKNVLLSFSNKFFKNSFFNLTFWENLREKSILSLALNPDEILNKGDLEINPVWCGNVKILKFMVAILYFWRPSWIDNGYLISLHSIYGNYHLYQFWNVYHKVKDRYTNCHILPFFIMQTGSSYLQIIPLILNQFWPNFVHI